MNTWQALKVAHPSTEPVRLTRAEIPGILDSVAGSTCMLDNPRLVELIEPLLYAKAGRGEAIALRNQEHSGSVRSAIKKSLGSLSLDRPTSHLAHLVIRRLEAHPSEYALNAAPSMTTIRGEIERLKSCQASTGSTASACYASTISST